MIKLRSLPRLALRDFVSLFYPDYCLGCSDSLVKGEHLICTRCMFEMPQTNYHLNPDNPLKLRMSGRIPVHTAAAFLKFTKGGRIQHILHALKYKNQPEVGVVLGRVFGSKLQSSHCDFDLIIPIPLHGSRLRKRGYNQSAKFAEGLSDILQVPFTDTCVKRGRKTETQTNKNKLTRWENVSSVFMINDRSTIENKHILLVDDVITTGATLEACAKVLLENGCRKISIACIAAA